MQYGKKKTNIMEQKRREQFAHGESNNTGSIYIND